MQLPLEHVPLVQKRAVQIARENAKPTALTRRTVAALTRVQTPRRLNGAHFAPNPSPRSPQPRIWLRDPVPTIQGTGPIELRHSRQSCKRVHRWNSDLLAGRGL